MTKNFKSRYFEDYNLDETINHSVPRTITSGDVSLYLATTGSRFSLNYSKDFAEKLGFKRQPLDDILVFHMVFGRTVPDLSLNAIANLGYADVRFCKPVFEGDTVYIRTGSNDDDVIIDNHEFLRDSGLYEKISSDDMIGEPVLDEPILSPTPTPDMNIIEELDSYMNEVHNTVSPWHIFIMLSVAFLITRLINIDLKLNVDI